MLLRGDGHILQEDRWLVDRHRPGFRPRRHALDMAFNMVLKNRNPPAGGIVHAHHEVPFTSWAFTRKIRAAGLMPSFRTTGDGYDNAMMESFWSSMQIELLNRKKWRTRVEVGVANANFDYIKIFYNRQRRHSRLDYVSPVEHELRYGASVPA